MTRYIELLVTLGFLGAMLWGMMKFMLRDIHGDLVGLKEEMKETREEIKEIRADMKAGFARSDARIDHLYEENSRIYKVLFDLVSKLPSK